jgi:hypothetical protein
MKTEQAYISDMDAAKTLQGLKEVYRAAAKDYHPDLHAGIDHMIMGRINNAYDRIAKTLAQTNDWGQPATEKQYEAAVKVAEEYTAIIVQLLKLEGLVIEICGSWLWISGDTRQHRDALKAIGLIWSPNKQMWYWRPAEHKSSNRCRWEMDRIREKFGARRIDSLDDDQPKPACRTA